MYDITNGALCTKLTLHEGSKLHDGRTRLSVRYLLGGALRTQVVRPEWIVDSIAQGRVLDLAGYQLFTKEGRGQQMLTFPSKSSGSVTQGPDTLPSRIPTNSKAKSPPREFMRHSDAAAPAIDSTHSATSPEAIHAIIGDDRTDSIAECSKVSSVLHASTTRAHQGSAAMATPLRQRGPMSYMDNPEHFLDDFQQQSRLHQMSEMKNAAMDIVRAKQRASEHTQSHTSSATAMYVLWHSSRQNMLYLLISLICAHREARYSWQMGQGFSQVSPVDINAWEVSQSHSESI